MPCMNGVCWQQGQQPPWARVYPNGAPQIPIPGNPGQVNRAQPQPIAPGTAQLSPGNKVLPQIEQMGVQQPAPINPVNQGTSKKQCRPTRRHFN